MVMNLLREGVPIDIIVCIPDFGFYEQEAISLGAKVYHLPRRSDGFISHHRKLKKIIKENKYKTVHINTQNAFLAYLQVKIAKHARAKRVFVHSHNTMDWRGKWLLKLHHLFQKRLFRVADMKLACSTEAARWLFGMSAGVQIIPLPINCELFKKTDKRGEKRAALGLRESDMAIVCVGRFSDVKNQGFLIDILEYLDSKYKLILVGEGSNLEKVKENVRCKGLENRVIFTGVVKTPYEILNASDIFILPSFYEGFPTVVLEAVASELPCLISDTVSDDMDKFKTVKKEDLKKGAKVWAEDIKSIEPDQEELKKTREIMKKEYASSIIAKRMMSIYGEKK